MEALLTLLMGGLALELAAELALIHGHGTIQVVSLVHTDCSRCAHVVGAPARREHNRTHDADQCAQ
jgi:hypothetical protein